MAFKKKNEVSAESEIKKIEAKIEEEVKAVEAEATKVEEKAKEEVAAVETKVKEEATKVVDEAKKIEEEIISKIEGKPAPASEEAKVEDEALTVDPQTSLREAAVAVMNLLVAEKLHIDYKQLRPMSTRGISSIAELLAALKNRVAMDCSESVTLIAHIAGWRDPSALGFDGYGDTQTILDNKSLKHFTDPKEANACSLVIFDADKPLNEQHIAIVHTADKVNGNPLLFSHGTQGDPSFITFENLQHAFTGKTVFVAVSALTQSALI